jgi:hypothetical protein
MRMTGPMKFQASHWRQGASSGCNRPDGFLVSAVPPYLPPIIIPPGSPPPFIIGPLMVRIAYMLSCIACICSCIGFWRSFGSVVALSYFICCCISFMFSCIWDIRLSMPTLIAGLAGADLFCAETIGADGTLVTIAAADIGVFTVVFPLGLNKFMFPLPVTAGLASFRR